MTQHPTQAIASYVTDMLALEHHLDKALTGQIADLNDSDPDVAGRLKRFRESVVLHVAALEGLPLTDAATSGVAETLKKTVSAIAGVGAAAIDAIRTETVPKNLRDDYAAFSLAIVGYQMLHTTAATLGDVAIAGVAEEHLRDYTQLLVELQAIVPAAVVRYLQRDGMPADPGVLNDLAPKYEEIWRSGAEAAREEIASGDERHATMKSHA